MNYKEALAKKIADIVNLSANEIEEYIEFNNSHHNIPQIVYNVFQMPQDDEVLEEWMIINL